ncbi:MAG: adenosylcobinamide-GDP ribazoletransferase [Methanomicrobiales archaeon]
MKSILSLLQFTTILPLGKSQDLEPFARHSYLYPVAGYVIGALVAIPVLFIADHSIAAAVAIALIMLISGAHHFDGLLDLGDGLMAHGDCEERIRALTDRFIGAGGVAAGVVITLLLFAGLQTSTSLVFAIIIGEVCAKFSMTVLTAYGKPFRQGIHSYLHQFSQPYFPFIAAFLCMPILLIPLAPFKLVGAVVAALLCPTIMLGVSNRLFGGVNGDVVGATSEITRACAVLALVIF